MNRLDLFLCAALTAIPLSAQGPRMRPAEEVQRFADLVGTWTGEGTSRMDPGMEEETWTATSSYGWVLGGHWLREDTRVEMPSSDAPMQMINLLGWDAENQRYVMIAVNNMGMARLQRIDWTPDGKMVSASSMTVAGMPSTERMVTAFGDGKMRFFGDVSNGDGDFFRHVAGTMKRTSEDPEPVGLVAAAFMPEMSGAALGKMNELASMCGSYRMEGWFKMEESRRNFSGAELYQPLFGGVAIEMTTKGDPVLGVPDLDALGWITWDPQDNSYRVVYANNFGESGSDAAHLMGNQFLMVGAGRFQGNVSARRHIFELGENGIRETSAEIMTGTEAHERVFFAEYTRQAN